MRFFLTKTFFLVADEWHFHSFSTLIKLCISIVTENEVNWRSGTFRRGRVCVCVCVRAQYQKKEGLLG